MSYFKNILKTQYTIHALIIGIVFFILTAVYNQDIFTFISFILLFTVYDVFGWGNAVHLKQRWNDESITKPYRVMQNSFMVVSFILIFLHSGWLGLLACFTGWWFGGCDVLYYVFLRIDMSDDDYYWMRGWSIWLFYRRYIEFQGTNEFLEKMKDKSQVPLAEIQEFVDKGELKIKTIIPKFGFTFVGLAGLLVGVIISLVR